MQEMIRRYGAQKGKTIFYATAHTKGLAPKKVKRKRVKRRQPQ